MWGDRDESGGLAVGPERGREGSFSLGRSWLRAAGGGEGGPELGGLSRGGPRGARVGSRQACREGLGSAANATGWSVPTSRVESSLLETEEGTLSLVPWGPREESPPVREG